MLDLVCDICGVSYKAQTHKRSSDRKYRCWDCRKVHAKKMTLIGKGRTYRLTGSFTCVDCAKQEQFTKNKYANTDKKLRCMECSLRYSTKTDPNYLYKQQLYNKYNLSLEEYQARVEKQLGCCAICNQFVAPKLVVDHDHSTNRVRDLLCAACNTALGHFKEDTTVMLRAIQYLERHKCPT